MSDGWTNKKLQKDPEGYLKWQREQKEKEERERKEAEEKSDFEAFKRAFLERGGPASEVEDYYRRYRSDMALEAAKKAEQATRNQMRSDRSRAV